MTQFEINTTPLPLDEVPTVYFIPTVEGTTDRYPSGLLLFGVLHAPMEKWEETEALTQIVRTAGALATYAARISQLAEEPLVTVRALQLSRLGYSQALTVAAPIPAGKRRKPQAPLGKLPRFGLVYP